MRRYLYIRTNEKTRRQREYDFYVCLLRLFKIMYFFYIPLNHDLPRELYKIQYDINISKLQKERYFYFSLTNFAETIHGLLGHPVYSRCTVSRICGIEREKEGAMVEI